MSGSASPPEISVVIPTYNWSAALRCAIRSVLLQTFQNFEVLVVGDGCTDDTADVVASFGDSRIRWHNLERNFGSQWAANNYGIENARSDWIAYLGHDDIWYPTHLESILRAAKHHDADVVTTVMMLYGPPGSGVRGVAGLFATGSYASKDFVPPSAFSHARHLYGDVIKWRDPSKLSLPMDALFMSEVAASAKAFASTRELTSFKFNAAWRRDSYKIKSVVEQTAMLEKIVSGSDFRHSELTDLAQSVVEDRFFKIEMPVLADQKPGWVVQQNRRFKGADARFSAIERNPVRQTIRFNVENATMPFEWHKLERRWRRGSYRWTGPAHSSTVDLPIDFDRDLLIRVKVVNWLASIENVSVEIHGHRLPVVVQRNGDGSATLLAEARRAECPRSDRDFGVTLRVDRTLRPCDAGRSEDRRWLGIAVSWVEIEPLVDRSFPPDDAQAAKKKSWLGGFVSR